MPVVEAAAVKRPVVAFATSGGAGGAPAGLVVGVVWVAPPRKLGLGAGGPVPGVKVTVAPVPSVKATVAPSTGWQSLSRTRALSRCRKRAPTIAFWPLPETAVIRIAAVSFVSV